MNKFGKYGTKIKNNMEENFKQRYFELMNDGSLENKILKKEKIIIEKKYILEKVLKTKYKKPDTKEFIVIAKYNQMIDEMCEELLKEYIEEVI